MRWTGLCLTVAMLCAAACGGGEGPAVPTPDAGPGDEACPTGRACPVTCNTSAECPSGQECNGGLCANPIATVRSYSVCGLDSDCPPGDHCVVGVCEHQCVADRDCTDGKVCDARGRCTTPEAAGQPLAALVPATESPVLAVNVPHVDFGAVTAIPAITVRNTGSGTLHYRIIADKPWLDASPVRGEVAAGAAATVRLKVSDVEGSGGQTGAVVSVLSSGGSVVLPIAIPARLDGTYQGTLTVSAPVALGAFPLALSLVEAADGSVSGMVDAARSPALGLRVPITGTRQEDGSYALAFRVPGHVGTAANPSLTAPLVREVSLTLTPRSATELTGTYRETIRGPLAVDVVVTGSAALTRTSARLSLAPDTRPMPSVDAAPSAPTWAASCTTCPDGTACPADPVAAGQRFLAAAFPLYANDMALGYGAVAACISNPGGCYRPAYLECAQKNFHAALAAGDPSCTTPTGLQVGRCGTRGLLDTFKGQMAWRMLQTNQLLVEGAKWGVTLDSARSRYDAASKTMPQALLPDRASPSDVRAPADAYFLRWLAALEPIYFDFNTRALLPEKLASGTGTPDYNIVDRRVDLVRPLEALALLARTSRHSAQAAHRRDYGLGDFTASQAIAQRATADAYLLGAVFGHILRARDPDRRAPAALAAEVTELALLSSRLAERINPAGVPDEVVLYIYESGGGGGVTNFQQVYQHTIGHGGPLSLALDDEEAAAWETRDFETNHSLLTQELLAEANSHDQRLQQLCGGSSLESIRTCGLVLGAVFDSMSELRAAELRVRQARDAIVTKYAAIEIEEQRASDTERLRRNMAEFILETGERELVLAQREADLQRSANILGTFTGLLGAAGSGNPGAALGAIAGGAGAMLMGDAQLKITEERTRLASKERAEVEFTAMRLELVNSAAQVKLMALEIPSLRIDQEMAAISAAQALARVQADLQTVQTTILERDRALALRSGDPRTDPSFRAYRDATVLLAEKSFASAQQWAFYTVRAYEYETNQSYGRRAQLFELTSADELRRYLLELYNGYLTWRTQNGAPQSRVTTVSVRRDLLGIHESVKDPVTGVEYSPAELFRRYIADPRRRDAQGNLALAFDLDIGPTSTLFSTTVCNDRVTGIRASLVGAQLGVTQAQVELSQRGTGVMRSCGERDAATGQPRLVRYDLATTVGQRRSLVQAGVNLSGPNDPNALPWNTEMHGRPIAAQWVLRIDQKTEPENRSLDLSKLDDIQLYLTHDTNTLQLQ